MSSRYTSLLAVLLFIGCGKDEPPPSRIIVADDPAEIKEKAPPAKQKPVEEKSVPKPEENVRAKLVPFNLRPYGIYAEIDAPIEPKVRQLGATDISGSDGFSLSIKPGSADLAKIRREAAVNFKVNLLIDNPSAVLVQYSEGDTHRFSFYVNVKIGDKPYQIEKTNDSTATEDQVRRNVAAALSMRQTPDLKNAKQLRDNAETILRSRGAAIEDVADGSNTSQILFAPGRKLDEKSLALLPQIPELSEVDLRVNAKLTPAVCDYLQALPRLTRLALGGAWVNGQVLARISEMTNLRVLRISNAPITDASLRSIANLTELTELYLNGPRIGNQGLRSLQAMKNLKYLHLNGTDVTDKGLALLKNFDLLRELSLSDTAITDAGLPELAALKELVRLDISETQVTDAGIESLMRTPRRLEINLTGANVSAACVAKIKAAGTLTLLQPWPIVEADPAKVTAPLPIDKLPPANPVALVEKLGGKLRRDEQADGKPIVAIDLHGKNVSDADLAQLRSLTRLQSLNLEGCKAVSDSGLPYLAGLTGLEELNLSATNIKGNGLVYLKGLTGLTKLFLSPNSAFTGKQLSPLADLPNLEVITLRFHRNDYPVFAVLSRMTRLKQLNLDNAQLTNRKMEFLKGLKNLESLNLGSEGQLTDRGLDCLKELTGLKTLVMRNYQGSDAGLARLSALANLKTLELGGPLITDRGIEALKPLENLERLSLDGLNIGDAALKSIPNPAELLEFSAVGTQISDGGLVSLAQLAKIEVIDLSYTSVTDAGIAKLKDLEELRDLRLNGTKIDGHGFKDLAEVPHLHRLQVNGTKVDDAGAAAVSQLTGLIALDLGRTPITDAAIDHLAKLPILDELHLDNCENLTDKIVPALKKFPKLKRITLKGTKLTNSALDELRTAGLIVVSLGTSNS